MLATMLGSLLGVSRGPDLADHGDANLTGVLQLLFDLLGDVARNDLRLKVVDRSRSDHDPHLSAGLHRIDLVDPLELHGDLFESLEALDVGLERLPPGPRPCSGDGIRSLRED